MPGMMGIGLNDQEPKCFGAKVPNP